MMSMGNLDYGNSVKDLLILHCVGVQAALPKASKIVMWFLSNSGWIKVNTDGAANGALGAMDGWEIFCTIWSFAKGYFAIPLGLKFSFETAFLAITYAIEMA